MPTRTCRRPLSRRRASRRRASRRRSREDRDRGRLHAHHTPTCPHPHFLRSLLALLRFRFGRIHSRASFHHSLVRTSMPMVGGMVGGVVDPPVFPACSSCCFIYPLSASLPAVLTLSTYPSSPFLSLVVDPFPRSATGHRCDCSFDHQQEAANRAIRRSASSCLLRRGLP